MLGLAPSKPAIRGSREYGVQFPPNASDASERRIVRAPGSDPSPSDAFGDMETHIVGSALGRIRVQGRWMAPSHAFIFTYGPQYIEVASNSAIEVMLGYPIGDPLSGFAMEDDRREIHSFVDPRMGIDRNRLTPSEPVVCRRDAENVLVGPDRTA